MKRPHLVRPTLTQILLIIVIILQFKSITSHQDPIVSRTEVYNTGQTGASAYELWLQDGNSGNLQDYLQSLQGVNGTTPKNGQNGKDAVAYAVPANDGKNGLGCSVASETFTIVCGDSSLTIPIPKDGESFEYNQNLDTCYLQFKKSSERIWTDVIKDPECFNHGS